MTDDISELRRDLDEKAAALANLQIAFNDWKVMHSTIRMEVEIERLRAENERLRIEIGGLRSQLLGFRVETGEGSFVQNLSAAIHASEAIDAAMAAERGKE